MREPGQRSVASDMRAVIFGVLSAALAWGGWWLALVRGGWWPFVAAAVLTGLAAWAGVVHARRRGYPGVAVAVAGVVGFIAGSALFWYWLITVVAPALS